MSGREQRHRGRPFARVLTDSRRRTVRPSRQLNLEIQSFNDLQASSERPRRGKANKSLNFHQLTQIYLNLVGRTSVATDRTSDASNLLAGEPSHATAPSTQLLTLLP